jgi:hypothetical protein
MLIGHIGSWIARRAAAFELITWRKRHAGLMVHVLCFAAFEIIRATLVFTLASAQLDAFALTESFAYILVVDHSIPFRRHPCHFHRLYASVRHHSDNQSYDADNNCYTYRETNHSKARWDCKDLDDSARLELAVRI